MTEAVVAGKVHVVLVHLKGEYVLKSADMAAEYLHQAAENENPRAQSLLGKLYLMGEGAEQDADTA